MAQLDIESPVKSPIMSPMMSPGDVLLETAQVTGPGHSSFLLHSTESPLHGGPFPFPGSQFWCHRVRPYGSCYVLSDGLDSTQHMHSCRVVVSPCPDSVFSSHSCDHANHIGVSLNTQHLLVQFVLKFKNVNMACLDSTVNTAVLSLCHSLSIPRQ